MLADQINTFIFLFIRFNWDRSLSVRFLLTSATLTTITVILQTPTEAAFEELFAVAPEDPIQIHCVAVIGGFALFVSLTLFSLGLFQPSSNARKFALGAFAVLETLNIANQYRFPVRGEDHPPASVMEMPQPILFAMLAVALLGATLSKTDAQRREIVRAKQKAKSKATLYAKHGASKANKGD